MFQLPESEFPPPFVLAEAKLILLAIARVRKPLELARLALWLWGDSY